MITSYLDESFDGGATGTFVVGGVMGRGPALFELERKWKKLRERPDIEIAYFKASECQRGTGEFAKFVADDKMITSAEIDKLKGIGSEFLELIPREDYIVVHGAGVVQSDFYDVIKDTRSKEILGDSPYRLAYDLAMVQCAWKMKQVEAATSGEKRRHFSESSSRVHVSFVCDKHEEHTQYAREAFRALKAANPEAATYFATFSSEDDKDAEVLQAADAVVFEVRRALNLELGMYPGALREQFKILAEPHKVGLITHCNRTNLEHIVATHKPGEAFKMQDIMQMQFEDNIDLRIYNRK
jgi:hypothetical protein